MVTGALPGVQEVTGEGEPRTAWQNRGSGQEVNKEGGGNTPSTFRVTLRFPFKQDQGPGQLKGVVSRWRCGQKWGCTSVTVTSRTPW